MRAKTEREINLLAKTILAYVDDETLRELKLSPTDTRRILERLPLEPFHFSSSLLDEIKTTYPAPCDITAFDRILFEATHTELKARGDLYIGEQFTTDPHLYYSKQEQVISAPLKDRFTHSYMVGRTGKGKSNSLKHFIMQDLQHRDRGLILLSPENDIFQHLLPMIPDDRRDNLLYFDPADTTGNVVSLNPFDFSEAE